MIIGGLSLGAFLSLISLGLLIFLQTPEGGMGVILLFFVSFFIASASISALFGVVFLRPFRPPVGGFARSELVWIRRGILMGFLSTFILLLSVFDVRNLIMVLLVFVPLAFIEAYFVKRHGKSA